LQELAATIFAGRLGASVDEAALAINCDRDTVYKLLGAGRLTSSLIGRRRIVHVPSILKLMEDTTAKLEPRHAEPPETHALAPRAKSTPKPRASRGRPAAKRAARGRRNGQQ
jgi:excisionase family DNA binding protein